MAVARYFMHQGQGRSSCAARILVTGAVSAYIPSPPEASAGPRTPPCSRPCRARQDASNAVPEGLTLSTSFGAGGIHQQACDNRDVNWGAGRSSKANPCQTEVLQKIRF